MKRTIYQTAAFEIEKGQITIGSVAVTLQHGMEKVYIKINRQQYAKLLAVPHDARLFLFCEQANKSAAERNRKCSTFQEYSLARAEYMGAL